MQQQKIKFTIDQQVDHMKKQNIGFGIYSEERARDFLTYSNYYFKVKSFAKNYKKNNDQ